MLICPLDEKLCLDEECGIHENTLVFKFKFVGCKKVINNDIYFIDKDGNLHKVNKSEQEK